MPGSAGRGSERGRAGAAAFPRPFRSIPAPQEGAPPGCGALRHGRRSAGRAALPSLRRWDGAAGAATSGPAASRRSGRRAARVALRSLRAARRSGAAGRAGARAAVAQLTERGRVRRTRPARGGAGTLLPEPGRPRERKASGFGGLLSSPDGLTGSAPLQLQSAAKANGAPRCAPQAAGRGQSCGSRATDQVRAGFVRLVLALGRAAREEIMYFSSCVEALEQCVRMESVTRLPGSVGSGNVSGELRAGAGAAALRAPRLASVCVHIADLRAIEGTVLWVDLGTCLAGIPATIIDLLQVIKKESPPRMVFKYFC